MDGGSKEYKSNQLDKNSCYNFEEKQNTVPKNFKNENQIINVINI